MMPQRNRATVFTAASAERTQDSDGNPTVTLRATFSQDSYSQTNITHLSRAAALGLVTELVVALYE